MALSRARIADAALALAAEDGLDAVTMRAVAARLDVEAMSLYRHVADKADLLDAVHDALLARVPSPGPGPWAAEVRRVATAFRELAAENPRLVPLLARPGSTPNGGRLIDDGVRVLLAAGFRDDEAVIAFQTVFAFVVGHAVFHAGAGTGRDAARREFDGGLEIVLAGLLATRPG